MVVKTARKFYNFIHTIIQNKYMIRNMVIRDLRTRYIGSFLGFFWTIIHPLTQILIYYFLFSVIVKIKLGSAYGGTNFGLWLICGLLPWFFFSEIIDSSPDVILNQADIIKKSVFPSEILPLTLVLTAFVNHIIGFIILVAFLLISGIGISVKILLALPVLFSIGIFAIGISWALSALNVFYRDIGQIVSVVLSVWFFGTPIIYPFDRVPEQFQTILRWNPMVHLVEAYRWALLGKTELEVKPLLIISIPILITFIFGGLFFKRLKPAFTDVL